MPYVKRDLDGNIIGYSRMPCGDHAEYVADVEAAKSQAQKDAKARDNAVLALVATRDAALAALTHDFGDGRVVQVRPPQFAHDESNMRNAIERLGRGAPTDKQKWLAADNSVIELTGAELKAALDSAQDQGAVIWSQFFSGLEAL